MISQSQIIRVVSLSLVSSLSPQFFDDQIFYRVIPGFLTQFGVAADPHVMESWNLKQFADEPKKVGFEHGTVSFAGAGDNSRSCHIFIAMQPGGNNLGSAPHETPLGRIVEGIQFLDRLASNYVKSGYPDLTELQSKIGQRGNVAAKDYPKLDRIYTCRVKDPNKKDAISPLWLFATVALTGAFLCGFWQRYRRRKARLGVSQADEAKGLV